MNEHYEDELSPRFKLMAETIKEILSNTKKPMTVRQFVEKLDNTDFLSDALASLESAGYIENVGGVILPRYRLAAEEPRPTIPMRVCRNCGIEKPLREFEREWSGEPAKKCLGCRTLSLKDRDGKLVEYNRQRRLKKGEELLPTKKS